MIVQLSQTREQMWWKPCHDLGRNPSCRMLCSRPLCPQKTIIGWHDILSSVKVKRHDTWESLEVPCPILSQDMQTKWTSTKYLVSLMPWRRGNHTFAESNANAEILTLAHWELYFVEADGDQNTLRFLERANISHRATDNSIFRKMCIRNECWDSSEDSGMASSLWLLLISKA